MSSSPITTALVLFNSVVLGAILYYRGGQTTENNPAEAGTDISTTECAATLTTAPASNSIKSTTTPPSSPQQSTLHDSHLPPSQNITPSQATGIIMTATSPTTTPATSPSTTTPPKAPEGFEDYWHRNDPPNLDYAAIKAAIGPKPSLPRDDECCGEGCGTGCVFDVYDRAYERFLEKRAKAVKEQLAQRSLR